MMCQLSNANEDRCAEPGTMVSRDIEHDIGSGSSGGGGDTHYAFTSDRGHT